MALIVQKYGGTSVGDAERIRNVAQRIVRVKNKGNKVVAVVGASKNPEKEAFTVPLYLQEHGYAVIPVNPTTDSISGVKAYPSLTDIPLELAEKVEVVEVFRPSEELPTVATQTVEMKRKTGRPFVFWAQLGLENEEAKKILRAAGIEFVMNACMRTQHQMLGGAW
jgi:predicted CoA-binding protein